MWRTTGCIERFDQGHAAAQELRELLIERHHILKFERRPSRITTQRAPRPSRKGHAFHEHHSFAPERFGQGSLARCLTNPERSLPAHAGRHEQKRGWPRNAAHSNQLYRSLGAFRTCLFGHHALPERPLSGSDSTIKKHPYVLLTPNAPALASLPVSNLFPRRRAAFTALQFAY
jgi:hypothetical protein